MRLKLLMSLFVCTIIFSSFFGNGQEFKFCGRTYITKKTKLFLKDEGINSSMIEVRDKKTNRFAFGYFANTIRNDTNFIYSRITQINDTIINKTYRDYKITRGTDSVITKFVCTKNTMRLFSTQRFWNGKKVEDTIHNAVLIRFN